jgi:hypothetical protein
MIAKLIPTTHRGPTNPQIAPSGPQGPVSRRGQLGPQQLRYMALRSDSSAPDCLRPSSAAARAAPRAAAWGASPASRSRAPAPAALSLCARTAATVAATHIRLISNPTASFPKAPSVLVALSSLRYHCWLWRWENEEDGAVFVARARAVSVIPFGGFVAAGFGIIVCCCCGARLSREKSGGMAAR